jgi:hypothetical protein
VGRESPDGFLGSVKLLADAYSQLLSLRQVDGDFLEVIQEGLQTLQASKDVRLLDIIHGHRRESVPVSVRNDIRKAISQSIF